MGMATILLTETDDHEVFYTKQGKQYARVVHSWLVSAAAPLELFPMVVHGQSVILAEEVATAEGWETWEIRAA